MKKEKNSNSNLENNEHSLKVKEAIASLSSEMNIHPHEVTKKMLLDSELVTDWTLKRCGGIQLVKNAWFAINNKDLKGIIKNKEEASYVKSLEKALGKKQLQEEEVLNILKQIVVPLPKIKQQKFKGKKTLRREVVCQLNDTHFGLLVPEEEVGGINKFSWTEACRRMSYFAKQVAEYKIEKRHEHERLHIVINSDIIQGMIHDITARTSELLVYQQNGATHILTHFISYVSQYYKSVHVTAVSGNHPDSIHRREGGRVISHKHDSYESPIYYALSVAFRNNKHITFNVPKGFCADLDLLGGRALVTHGDTLFSKQLGNPGASLGTRSLGDAIARYNSGERQQGKQEYKLVLMGHVHFKVMFTTYEGVEVVIPPSLSGVDIYAKHLGINNNQIGQLVFESTEDHIISDPRVVALNEADKMKELDSIIPVYNNEMIWKSK